jgi:hypothetical protein
MMEFVVNRLAPTLLGAAILLVTVFDDDASTFEKRVVLFLFLCYVALTNINAKLHE